jgi:hypothetical protein
VQFEVSTREGFEADAIGGLDIAMGGEVRPPSGQRPDELHASHVAQVVAQPVRHADDRVLDHLLSDASGGHGRLSAGHEGAQRFDQPSRLRRVAVRWPAKAA